MITIPIIKPNHLYYLEWFIEEDDREGFMIGTFDILQDPETNKIIFIDFKIDGDINIYRIPIQYVIEIKEYNYEKKIQLFKL